MVINDEISKEIKGHKDILAINIYRFNAEEIDIEDEIDIDKMALKIAEQLKSRYSFFKVALPGNKKAGVYMIETVISNLNEITIISPEDVTPTEGITMQIEISKILEEEGFSKKNEEDIPEFSEDIVSDEDVEISIPEKK